MKSRLVVVALLLITGCLPYPIQGFIDNNPQSVNGININRFNYSRFKHKAIMLIGISIHPDSTKGEFVIDLTRIKIASAQENTYIAKSINYNGKNMELDEESPLTLSISPGHSYNVEYVVESENKLSNKEFIERITTDTLIVLINQGDVIGKCWFRSGQSPK